MNLDTLNSLVSLPVMASWALLLFAPRTRVTRVFLESDAAILAIGVLYVIFAVPHAPEWTSAFRNLDTIATFMSRRDVLFIGWIHYLAFDLFVGRSIVADAQRRGISHAFVAPCLVLTFLSGPAGYLAYALVRLLLRKHGAVNPLPRVVPQGDVPRESVMLAR